MERKALEQLSRKKRYIILELVLLALVMISGLTVAWYVRNQKIATLMKIKEPDNITILGPNASKLERLDLSYTKDDVDPETGQVTIDRIICVQSSAEYHQLEIVHTTNMENLVFSLYAVSEDGESEVTDGGMTVYYKKENALEGTHLNREKTENNHSYADKKYHGDNYDTYDNVQSHAEPVYWLVNDNLQANVNNSPESMDPGTGTQVYNTYYVLEITWTETTKETDVFYILARNAQSEQ